jgi:hypothetical protein
MKNIQRKNNGKSGRSYNRILYAAPPVGGSVSTMAPVAFLRKQRSGINAAAKLL